VTNVLSDLLNSAATTPPQAGDVICLKLLVISAYREDPNLDAICSLLNWVGVPYDVLVATEETLSQERLWIGGRAHYQGVVITTGNLGQWNCSTEQWESVLSAEQWALLWRFEARFGIRQLTLFAQPGGEPDDYGLELEQSFDTKESPLAVTFTALGRSCFSYLKPACSIPISDAWVSLTTPKDACVEPLLVTPQGQCVAAIRRYADGREHLALTMTHNPHLLHTLLLGYGLVNWVTRRLFIGQRHFYLSLQVDDIFNFNHLWDTAALVEERGPVYRLNQWDVEAMARWLKRIQREYNCEITLDLAFNGAGALSITPEDALVESLLEQQTLFRWINHSYTHQLLDHANYAVSLFEIQRNHNAALMLNLQRYEAECMVTPDVSGLENPEFLRAANDAGLRYLVSDTSQAGWGNPAPNVGIVCQFEPNLLLIPRHANNLFYDVSTPAEWVSKYNHMYRSFWGRDLTIDEIVEREAENILRYLLRFDLNPHMFHQVNLRAYDKEHSLLSDLIDRVLARYQSYYGDAPIISLSMRQIGEAMNRRAACNAANVQALFIRNQGVMLLSARKAVIPLTGVTAEQDCECYAGQCITWLEVIPDNPVFIPAADLVGYEA
jgi:hypothetical protein